MYSEPIYAKKISKLPEYVRELLIDQQLSPDQVVHYTDVLCNSILNMIKEERSGSSEEGKVAGRKQS
ncbi:MAG: hypothetical protein ABW115_21200 [Candidatus Thiodiazotropha sp. 6PLUC6]